MTTIEWRQFTLPSSGTGPRPFVLVTPNGGSGTGTDGGDLGANTPITTTNGIQEALNQIASTGGTVYVAAGTYTLSTGVYNTGSNQALVFEAGVVIEFTSTATPISSPKLGLVWFAIGSSYNDSAKVNYSHVYWFGNGCTITGLPDLSNQSGGEFPTVFGLFQYGAWDSFSGNAGEDFIVDGFQIPDLQVNQPVWFVGADQYNTIPDTSAGLALKIRNVRLSRIFVAWTGVRPAVTPAAPEMNVCQGAWHDVEIADCAMDASPQASFGYGDAGTLFIRANSGDSEQLVVRRCYFRGLGAGEVIELQGCGTYNNHANQRICQQLYLEDCTVDSGGEFLSSAIYLNDSNYPGTSCSTPSPQNGVLTNVEFRRCVFINCGVTLNAQISGPCPGGPYAHQQYFGYIRFVDCVDGSGSASPDFPQISSNYGGVLDFRYPMNIAGGATNFKPITVTASPFSYTNLDDIDEFVTVVGGSGVSVSWATSPTAGSNGTYRLRAGDSITVTYGATAPSMAKYAV